MSLTIDPTSVILFATGSVTMALILCVALRRRKGDDRAIQWLMASNLALFVATMGVLLRPFLGFDLGTALVLSGAYLGICFAYFGVLRAEDRPLPIRLVGGVGVFGAGVHILVGAQTDSVWPLMVSSSVINSAMIAYMLVTLWPLARSYGTRMATLLCLPFALLFVGYASRLGVIAVFGEGPEKLIVTLLIIVAMSWGAVILELGLIALREMQALRDMKAAQARAEEANQARIRFLLSISHDLRTPLNGIMGLSELMRQKVLGPLPEAYAAQAAEIHRNGEHLSNLLEDLLDAAGDLDPHAQHRVGQQGDAIIEAVQAKFEPEHPSA